jgi:hypothetical protein
MESVFNQIHYSGPMEPIPGYAGTVLSDIMNKSAVETVLITSTTRTPANQARIMFENLEKYGVEAQLALYKTAGKMVIEVYQKMKFANASKLFIIPAMKQKIIDLGSQNVSKHCANSLVRSVFDVAPTSIPVFKRGAFMVETAAHEHVDKFLKPPVDPAYHIEITI